MRCIQVHSSHPLTHVFPVSLPISCPDFMNAQVTLNQILSIEEKLVYSAHPTDSSKYVVCVLTEKVLVFQWGLLSLSS